MAEALRERWPRAWVLEEEAGSAKMLRTSSQLKFSVVETLIG